MSHLLQFLLLLTTLQETEPPSFVSVLGVQKEDPQFVQLTVTTTDGMHWNGTLGYGSADIVFEEKTSEQDNAFPGRRAWRAFGFLKTTTPHEGSPPQILGWFYQFPGGRWCAEVALLNGSIEDPYGRMTGNFIISAPSGQILSMTLFDMFDMTGHYLRFGEWKYAPHRTIAPLLFSQAPDLKPGEFPKSVIDKMSKRVAIPDTTPNTHQTGSPRNEQWDPILSAAKYFPNDHRPIIPLLDWCAQQMGTTLIGDFDKDGKQDFSVLPGRMYHLRDRNGDIFNCRVKYNIDGNGGWPGIGEFGADLREGGQDTLGRRALSKRQGKYETSRYNSFDYEHMTITQLVFCYVFTGSELAKDQALTIANLITQPHFIPERVIPNYDGNSYEIYAKQAHWSGRTLGWTGLAWIYADAIDGEDTFFRDAAYFTIKHAVEGSMVEKYGQAAKDHPSKWLYRTSNLSPTHPDGTYVFLKSYPNPDPTSLLPLRFVCTNELSAAYGALTQCYWTHERDPATWWMCNPIESCWKLATVGMACQQGALFDPDSKAKWDEWALYIADAITYCWAPGEGMREHYGIVRAVDGKPAWFGRGYGGSDAGNQPPQKVGTASWVVGTGAYALSLTKDEARFPWAKPMWEFQRNFHGGGEFPSRVGGSVWMRSHLGAADILDPHLN